MRTVSVLAALLLLAVPVQAQQVPNPMSRDGSNATPAAKEAINLDAAKNYYAFGDALFPQYAGAPRFQPKNSTLTNVLAAQIGNFGAAARGASTWVGAYHPWADLNWSSVFAISPIGQAAGTFAARMSDNTVPGSNMIPLFCFAVGDNPALAVYSWCQYLESRLLATSAQTHHIQIESSVDNHWTISGDETPYTVNPGPVSVRNLRLDNGVAAGSPKVMTAAMDIVNNGGQYRSGIVFDATAFDMTARAVAPAVAMAAKHGQCWYLEAGDVPNYCLWADNDANKTFRLHDMFRNQAFLTIGQVDGVTRIGQRDGTNAVVVDGTLYAKPPTSCSGVPAGALWNNAGTPGICP